jgi:DNA gyrase inhibitor GyrI
MARFARLAWVLLALAPGLAPAPAQAQSPDAVASGDAPLVLEHRFVEGTSETVTVPLTRRVRYWAVLSGPGNPQFIPAQRYRPPALVVAATARGGDGETWFELHPGDTGPHYVRLTGLAEGSAVTLRVYRDDAQTAHDDQARDHDFAVGLSLGAGVHSAYRLDPTAGLAESGSAIEGCLVADTGNWFSACLGGGRETLPGADLSVTWLFLEPRARLLHAGVLGGRRFDLGAAVRVAQATQVGRRGISPSLLAAGLYAEQHLSSNLRQRGLSLYAAWQHGRLGNVPETEDRDTDRFTAGLTWLP